MFHRRKKVIQIRNDMRVIKWWQNFLLIVIIFLVDCPFNIMFL